MTGSRKALIVANDEYEHAELRRLRSPARDAESLAGTLGDPGIGGFDVEVVRNEPAHVVSAHIEDFFSVGRPDDLLLLHFSCHGLKSEAGELFLSARNTRPTRLGSTAVPADFVQRCMRTSRARSIVLLLDCCYGGAFSQGAAVRAAGDVNVLDNFPAERVGGGRGRAVITACSSMEYAFEGDRLADGSAQRPSVFTSALVDGLVSGEADRDEDGWVALDELYDYVFDRVQEENPNQTPGRNFELQGELYIARSNRKRIVPVPVPEELRNAIADSNRLTRLGAVSELRSRLIGDNVPAAVGARDALAELVRADIEQVAAAAADALREAMPHPAETRLDFGRLRQDSVAPHRSVPLLGPPVARACTYKMSQHWIRVTETEDGLDVTVDTGRAGQWRSQIDLTAPTGGATVEVVVEVLATASTQPAPAQGPPAQQGPVPTQQRPAQHSQGAPYRVAATGPGPAPAGWGVAPGPASAQLGQVSGPPGPVSAPPGPVSAPPGQVSAPPGQAAGPVSAPPGHVVGPQPGRYPPNTGWQPRPTPKANNAVWLWISLAIVLLFVAVLCVGALSSASGV